MSLVSSVCYCLYVQFIRVSKFPLLSFSYTVAKPARKRRWGSTSAHQNRISSINISTDSLKVWLLTAAVCMELWMLRIGLFC